MKAKIFSAPEQHPTTQQPSEIPDPRQFHSALPADFFTRNYSKELAHQELASYVSKVHSDASLQQALQRIFTSKNPLNAGPSNAITLWVYAKFALKDLDLDGIGDLSFADLTGASITNVIISKTKFTNIEGTSFIGAVMDNVTIMNSNPHLALWGIPQEQGHLREYRDAHFKGDKGMLFSPKLTYKILFTEYDNDDELNPRDDDLDCYQIYDNHTGDYITTVFGSQDIVCGSAITFSPDELFVVSHTNNKSHKDPVFKLDEQERKNDGINSFSEKIHFWIPPVGSYKPFRHIFSPDSKKLAVLYKKDKSIIQVFDTQTWQVQLKTKADRTNCFGFYNNDTFLYISTGDKTHFNNQLRVWKTDKSTSAKKSSVVWNDFASVQLPNCRVAELQTFPTTNRIGIQYLAYKDIGHTQYCFYHLNGKELDLIYAWQVEPHLRQIHPNGLYAVTTTKGAKSDLQILCTTTGTVVHNIHFDWPRCPYPYEFTPDGKGLSFIRQQEQSRGWQYDERYFLALPRLYLSNRVIYSEFETKFNQKTVRVVVNDASMINKSYRVAHMPDNSISANNYISIYSKRDAMQLQEPPKEVDVVSHGPQKGGLSNQLQQEIEKRKKPSTSNSAKAAIQKVVPTSAKIQSSPDSRPKISAQTLKQRPVVVSAIDVKVHSEFEQAFQSMSIPKIQLHLFQVLGEGTFGIVHKGSWHLTELFKKKVAIKVLKNEKLSTRVHDDFKREIEIQSKLRSDEIVKLYGITTEQPYYMIMEFMAKGSLRDVLDSENQKSFSWELRIGIAKNIARGLVYLHEHDPQIIHGDLKSLNILLNKKYQAKLADFGLATLRSETNSRSSAQTSASKKPKGSLLWMAPELFEMNAKRRAEIDMFSFAVVLWELASHLYPYESANGNVALVKDWVVKGDRESFDERTPNTPKEYQIIVERCWKAEPSQRLTAAEALSELEKIKLFSINPQAPTLFPAAVKSAPKVPPKPKINQKTPPNSNGYLANNYVTESTSSAPSSAVPPKLAPKGYMGNVYHK